MIQHTAYTPGRTVETGGRTCLFFSGFAYLGLHQQEAFQHLLAEGIARYGTMFPSSRAGNLRLMLYEEAEHALCTHLGQQSAAVFSSGFLASQAAAQYGSTCGQLLYAPGAHPSLWHHQPAQQNISREEWIAQTIEKINAHPDHYFVVVSDTVNPLTSTIHSFDWLKVLQRKVLVIADDSHGIGILGPDGQGSIHFLPQLPQVRYLLTASLAKAYSVQGGVVAGHAADISGLKRTPLFAGSTPMAPANAFTWLNAASIAAKMRIALQHNVSTLQQLTSSTTVHNPHSLPMFILQQGAQLVHQLMNRDIIISSFPYPHPHSEPVNRAVVSALHLPEDLIALSKEIEH
jgi:7-keto-8-aminopelargonate synthetase-like enzyme